jgi:hypothetical protein
MVRTHCHVPWNSEQRAHPIVVATNTVKHYDGQLSGIELDIMGLCFVPQSELQLDIPFDSRQDALMILFLHRR